MNERSAPRRVILDETRGPSFRKWPRIPILFGMNFIHGKLRLENSSLVENTPLAALFSTSPGQRLLRALTQMGLNPKEVNRIQVLAYVAALDRPLHQRAKRFMNLSVGRFEHLHLAHSPERQQWTRTGLRGLSSPDASPGARDRN